MARARFLRDGRSCRADPGGAGDLVVRSARAAVRAGRMGLHRWSQALRLSRVRRALRLRFLRAGRHRGIRLRAARSVRRSVGVHIFAYPTTGPSCSGPVFPSVSSPPPSWRRTTCATSTPTPSPGRRPSPSVSGERAPVGSTLPPWRPRRSGRRDRRRTTEIGALIALAAGPARRGSSSLGPRRGEAAEHSCPCWADRPTPDGGRGAARRRLAPVRSGLGSGHRRRATSGGPAGPRCRVGRDGRHGPHRGPARPRRAGRAGPVGWRARHSGRRPCPRRRARAGQRAPCGPTSGSWFPTPTQTEARRETPRRVAEAFLRRRRPFGKPENIGPLSQSLDEARDVARGLEAVGQARGRSGAAVTQLRTSMPAVAPMTTSRSMARSPRQVVA